MKLQTLWTECIIISVKQYFSIWLILNGNENNPIKKKKIEMKIRAGRMVGTMIPKVENQIHSLIVKTSQCCDDELRLLRGLGWQDCSAAGGDC